MCECCLSEHVAPCWSLPPVCECVSEWMISDFSSKSTPSVGVMRY